MKFLAFIFSMALVYSASFAQGTRHEQLPTATDPLNEIEQQRERSVKLSDLKGPRAKNYPTHAYQGSEVAVAVPAEGAIKRMGPEAKNYRPWRDDTKVRRVVTKKKQEDLKGPRYKNRQPWNKQ